MSDDILVARPGPVPVFGSPESIAASITAALAGVLGGGQPIVVEWRGDKDGGGNFQAGGAGVNFSEVAGFEREGLCINETRLALRLAEHMDRFDPWREGAKRLAAVYDFSLPVYHRLPKLVCIAKKDSAE